MDPASLKKESTADLKTSSIYPQLSNKADSKTAVTGMSPTELHQAYVTLMMSFISSVVKELSKSPMPPTASSSDPITTVGAASTGSAALSLLANIMQPVGSAAVNLISSSSSLWQRWFSGDGPQMNSELARRKQLLVWLETGAFREVAHRICSLLSEVEICCQQTGWG